ncbi:MAG: hypothetical protein K8J31_01850 [Anaerolineae bacterium]|nr:hypothetical protein [Anaerolineae bacterium]
MSDSAFEIILDECLDAVLSDARTIDDCLALYPEHAAELKSALQIGLLAKRLKQPEMEAGSLDALEMRLRGQMLAARQPAGRARLAPLSRLAAMVALVFLFTLGAGGGVVAASAHSLPGDPLYGVKRLWEAIVLALASWFDGTDDVWLSLAETRLDEAEDLATHGILYRDVLYDLYDATEHAMTLADADTAPRVVVFLNQAQTRLQDLPTTAATDPVRAELFTLIMPGPDGRLRVNSLEETPEAQPETATSTPTVIPSWTPSPDQPSTTPVPPTRTPAPTSSPTQKPTSRVPATATRTPSPTVTPTFTVTPSLTPTHTWTPLPLPVLPTTQGGSPSNGSRVIGPSATPVQPTSDATVRYRATQAAVYATQTAQAAFETEEPQP